jgi:hypothetical protein
MIETRMAYNREQNRLKINKNTEEPGKNILILEMGFFHAHKCKFA